MGFGYAIYRRRDPRNAILKDGSRKLADLKGDTLPFTVSDAIGRTMKEEKNMFANVDFFHAGAYNLMGVPTKLFTPLFVIARITGWAALCYEQRANNRIIRPGADYIGPPDRSYLPMDQR